MIQQASKKDLHQLIAFLERDEVLNLPMLGNLERYGFDGAFQECWVQTDGDGHWHAVLHRFFGHYTLYVPAPVAQATGSGDGRADWEELALFLRFSGPESVSGEKSTIERVMRDEAGSCEEAACMMLPGDGALLTGLSAQPDTGDPPERATDSDAVELGTLIYETEAFRRNYRHAGEVAEGIRARLRAGGVRHLVIRSGGRIVSHANTTAETRCHALISGVTTRPEARRRGYAAKLVSALCMELLREGRMPCLFAKSPAVMALYRRLGFVETGRYLTWRR